MCDDGLEVLDPVHRLSGSATVRSELVSMRLPSVPVTVIALCRQPEPATPTASTRVQTSSSRLPGEVVEQGCETRGAADTELRVTATWKDLDLCGWSDGRGKLALAVAPRRAPWSSCCPRRRRRMRVDPMAGNGLLDRATGLFSSAHSPRSRQARSVVVALPNFEPAARRPLHHARIHTFRRHRHAGVRNAGYQ